MLCYVNGKYVPAEASSVSVFDRGLMYGDGCFETIRLYQGQPAFWTEHLQRLHTTLDFLGIPVPKAAHSWQEIIPRLVHENQSIDGIARIQITRGPGARGYSPDAAGPPTVIVSTHPAPQWDRAAPPSWTLSTSSLVIDAGSPLHTYKTSNKLLQILGRTEADAAGCDEVLFLNQEGYVTEASSANLFWLTADGLNTPPANSGILPGVTRQVLMRLAKTMDLDCQEALIKPSDLPSQKAVFLTQSAWEVISVASVDGTDCPNASLVSELQSRYHETALASLGYANRGNS